MKNHYCLSVTNHSPFSEEQRWLPLFDDFAARQICVCKGENQRPYLRADRTRNMDSTRWFYFLMHYNCTDYVSWKRYLIILGFLKSNRWESLGKVQRKRNQVNVLARAPLPYRARLDSPACALDTPLSADIIRCQGCNTRGRRSLFYFLVNYLFRKKFVIERLLPKLIPIL